MAVMASLTIVIQVKSGFIEKCVKIIMFVGRSEDLPCPCTEWRRIVTAAMTIYSGDMCDMFRYIAFSYLKQSRIYSVYVA